MSIVAIPAAQDIGLAECVLLRPKIFLLLKIFLEAITPESGNPDPIPLPHNRSYLV